MDESKGEIFNWLPRFSSSYSTRQKGCLGCGELRLKEALLGYLGCCHMFCFVSCVFGRDKPWSVCLFFLAWPSSTGVLERSAFDVTPALNSYLSALPCSLGVSQGPPPCACLLPPGELARVEDTCARFPCPLPRSPLQTDRKKSTRAPSVIPGLPWFSPS